MTRSGVNGLRTVSVYTGNDQACTSPLRLVAQRIRQATRPFSTGLGMQLEPECRYHFEDGIEAGTALTGKGFIEALTR
jgi:hypothetical protein